ncbi:ATP-dependent DNA helicase [Adhaeribacter soli]|uniref:AAA family ATPase n=1 Tax=Adhaeribacter soli TaxID=2607655 RepID=A0A5N1IMS2_9BACT|nr:AAA family ATPase [Adhaeribacter soli]KAA9331147.1 AAA family ATPase [Adhaeribacter soli]
MHITIRLAWHSNGWNGKVCSNPEENTYCIGQQSYPGDYIKGAIELAKKNNPSLKAKPCLTAEGIPVCGFSINAFGGNKTKAAINPPTWFNKEARPALIDIPESTVCIWNYEGMYSDDVNREPGKGQKYDYNQRLKNANDYFDRLRQTEGKSLLFYYANYSNPFSEDEQQNYVIVGVSRLKKVGKIHYYDGVSEEIKKKYAGGFVWQMPVSSNYPDEGFVIPYHKYMDRPEVLERILLVPDNKRNFKYATREVPDDDALALVERMIEIASFLIELGDDSQNWVERRKWLLSLFSDLWKKRGAYPGLPQMLSIVGFEEAIEFYKEQTRNQLDKEAYKQLNELLIGNIKTIEGLRVSSQKLAEVKRNWKLREADEQELLLQFIPRFALSVNQIKNILQPARESNSLYCSLTDISQNPYLLCEQYVGDNDDDIISFHSIDHGILPNPELGLEPIFTKNSAERFRALCVEVLKRENIHSFVSQTNVLFNLNQRLSYLPEWKNHQFTPRYFDVDAEFIEQAITIRKHEGGENYLYLNSVREDEKLIFSTIKNINTEDIQLRVTIDEDHFYHLLKDPNSSLNEKAPKEYDKALKGQAKVCVKVFTKPVCIISGAAGTGKTTILKSIIRSIEKAHGIGTGIILLAPTGKASVRMSEKTVKKSSTIHSFLAGNGWLNDNFTFKRYGKEVDTISTLIIDECSMIDLSLFATLFKSINWNSIQRLILVGDPNQLPPIGRGKVFNDIIAWMNRECPDNLGKLTINVRQLENLVNKSGNGILELADIYIQEKQAGESFNKAHQETILKKVQQGGVIDKDLTVHYWKEMTDLELMLKSVIITDLEQETGTKAEEGKAYEVWGRAIRKAGKFPDPSYLQILSPFRGEFYGTDYLNSFFQQLFNGYQANKTVLDGIALYDKVLQIRNRPQSNKISAYSWKEGKNVKIDIYNGELGFVYPHPFDKSKTSWSEFRLQKFHVKFERRDDYSVNYGYLEGYDNKPMFYEPVDENLELGYVISVHKAQGSEFNRTYLVLPKKKSSLLSMELLYTAITRAQTHLTIFAQDDVSTFIELSKSEKSNTRRINSSIFYFNPIPDSLFTLNGNWYEDQKVVSTLAEYFVRSKSEMNIANILHLNKIPFKYEVPKFAKDGSMYLPDFTILWKGEEYYWEHVGRLDLPNYKNHWETKQKWYEKHFPDKLITTYEGTNQTTQIKEMLRDKFRITIN